MNAVVLIFEEPAVRQIFFWPHPISTEILKIQKITQIKSSWIRAHKIKIEIEIRRLVDHFNVRQIGIAPADEMRLRSTETD